MVKAIVFDLWETVGRRRGVGNDLRKQFNLDNTPDFIEKYEKALQLNEWSNETEMVINFLNYFNVPVTDESIKAGLEIFGRSMGTAIVIDGIEELLSELKEKYKLGLLSNTHVFASKSIEGWGAIVDLFDAISFSWQTGFLKPSKESFEGICKRLDVSLNEVLFIDDGEKNIVKAREYGMKAIRFENLEQLRNELVEYGIK